MRTPQRRLNLAGFSVSLWSLLWAWPLLVAYAGINSFWTDSESWAVGVAGHLFQRTWGYFYGTKPLLDFLLWTAYEIGDGIGLNSMWVARLYMAINLFATLYLMRRLVRWVWRDRDGRYLEIWLFGLFLGHSFVIKRYLQVRSDLFTTTLLLLWVETNRETELREHASLPRTLGTFFACAGTAALITPKSVPLSLLTFVVFELVPKKRRALWLRWLRSLPGLTLATLVIVLSIAFVRRHSSDLDFLMESAREFDGGYLSLTRWQHVGQALLQNPIFAVALVLSLFVPARNGFARQLGHWGIAGFMFLALYPDRFPYFIASLVPLFILSILTRDWLRWTRHLRRFGERFFKAVVISTQLVLVLTSLGWCAYILNEHTCHDQDRWSAWFTQRMRIDYEYTVFDPDGLIHLPEIWHWYIGPAALSNQLTERKLMTYVPDIILGVERLNRLSRDFTYFIFENYWTDHHGIFIRRWDIRVPVSERDTIRCHDVLLALRSLVQAGHWPGKKQSKVMDDSVSTYVEAVVSDGHDVTLASANAAGPLTLPVLENCQEIAVPPDTMRISLTPAHITSPDAVDLDRLFRFDAEE